MKKRDITRCAVAALVVTSVGFAGCVDTEKDFSKELPTEAGIPNDFNFSTKKAVEFTLKYDVPTGYRVHFEMYSKSPLTLDAYKSYVKDQTLIPFFSGRADANGKVTYKGELPASVSEIYAYCSGFGMPVLMKASVSDAGVVSDFKRTEIPSASSTRNTTGASGTSYWKSYDVTIAKPALEAVSREISQEDKNLIEKSFSVGQSLDSYLSYRQSGIKLHKDATVKIYSVSNGGTSDRTNALAYYTYSSAQENNLLPQDITSKLDLIFPTLNKITPAEGAGYQLLYNGSKTFEAGTSIGFALFPNVGSGEIATKSANVLFSHYTVSNWNTYSFPKNDAGGVDRASVPHMVLSLLKIDNDGHAIIAIGFEDQPYDANCGTNRADFRDDIFILEVDPRSSLPEELPTPPVEEPEYDSEYAFSGILCFEDSWPEKGDYDMNDITIAYNRIVCSSDTYGPVAMKETYTFLNNGANYTNGFGYQLTGLTKADVIKCEVESDYQCVGQGLDKDLDDATIMLFDNGKNVKAGTTFTVYTSFKNPSYWGTVNPFIAVSTTNSLGGFLSEGRTEVHLPTTKLDVTKHLPTKKANTTLWGTSDDKSDPSQSIYYVRAGNYPFALDVLWDSSKHGLPTGFVVPVEKLSIEKTYPKFINWVESRGKKDTDWFLYPQK